MSNINKATEYIHANIPRVKCQHFRNTDKWNDYLMDKHGFWWQSHYVPSVTIDMYHAIPDFHTIRKQYAKPKEDI